MSGIISSSTIFFVVFWGDFNNEEDGDCRGIGDKGCFCCCCFCCCCCQGEGGESLVAKGDCNWSGTMVLVLVVIVVVVVVVVVAGFIHPRMVRPDEVLGVRASCSCSLLLLFLYAFRGEAMAAPTVLKVVGVVGGCLRDGGEGGMRSGGGGGTGFGLVPRLSHTEGVIGVVGASALGGGGVDNHGAGGGSAVDLSLTGR